MKSIQRDHKKSGGTSKWMAAAAGVMVLTVAATCVIRGIIPIPGLFQEEPVPGNTVQMAYTMTAVGAGAQANTALQFREVTIHQQTTLPDDAILPGENMQGYVLRFDLQANTPVTWSMLCPVETDEGINDSTRQVEVDYLSPSASLQAGDYIDIRMKRANSAMEYEYTDSIVVAKKKVVAVDGTLLTLELNEDELIRLTAAAVETNIANSTLNETKQTGVLYTTTYLSPGQRRAIVTYSHPELEAMLRSNPNFLNNPTGAYETLHTDNADLERGS